MTTTPKDPRAVIEQLVGVCLMLRAKLTAQVNGADESCYIIGMRQQVTEAQMDRIGKAILAGDEALTAGRDGPVSPPSGLAQENSTTPELDDPDRELVLKVKIALHSYSDGAPLRDELSESDIADALSLLIRCLPPGDAQEADIKFRAWYLDCCGEQTPVSKT